MNLLLTLLCTASFAALNPPPLNTVPHVELARYLGKWYEIARFPNRFQKDCEEATAEYSLLEDGNIRVTNRCISTDQEIKEVEGIAEVEDTTHFTKLRVTFLPSWLRWTGIGKGNYWIIQLEPNYQYAVVSEPERMYLWILSRAPTLAPATYEKILDQLRKDSFDVSRLIPSRKESLK